MLLHGSAARSYGPMTMFPIYLVAQELSDVGKETLGLVHFAVQRYDDGSIHDARCLYLTFGTVQMKDLLAAIPAQFARLSSAQPALADTRCVSENDCIDCGGAGHSLRAL